MRFTRFAASAERNFILGVSRVSFPALLVAFFLIFKKSQNLLILRPPGHQNRVSDLSFIYRDAPGLILVDSENFRKFQNFQPI